jgi:hypothetical protein
MRSNKIHIQTIPSPTWPLYMQVIIKQQMGK